MQLLRGKRKPVLLIGSKLRAAGAERQAIELADALGCAVAVMAAAKSFFPEDHPQYVATYWGEISSPGARGDRRLVRRGDLHRHSLFNDYSTIGWTAMPTAAITVDQHHFQMEGHDFSRIRLRDFLSALTNVVEKARLRR